jgi:hypothetical protein
MKLRPGIPVVRHVPHPEVHIPPEVKELPLIDKSSPDDMKIQQVWRARTKVFDLSDANQLGEYEKVWQLICDGHAQAMPDSKVDFVPSSGKYVAFLRWAEFDYKVPQATA